MQALSGFLPKQAQLSLAVSVFYGTMSVSLSMVSSIDDVDAGLAPNNRADRHSAVLFTSADKQGAPLIVSI